MNELKIPAVGKILNIESVIILVNQYSRELVKIIIMDMINDIKEGRSYYTTDLGFSKELDLRVKKFTSANLKKVINATGILVHTNLGRSPLNNQIGSKLLEIVSGYNNLEFNLDTAKRGSRQDLLKEKLTFLTGGEDVLVVNNNAASIILLLSTFAKNKKVIISRGELIEIGGSFRIHEIMKASGAKIVEVGSTNKTKISDYEDAIDDKTSMIFKAHKSNYKISGFTDEPSMEELVQLGKKHNILTVFDLGSGILRRPQNIILKDEPTVDDAVKMGFDLISFSGDKLLGGPQAGFLVGRKKLIKKMESNHLLRALRPGKLTLAALELAICDYLSDKKLIENNFVFQRLSLCENQLEVSAKSLKDGLELLNIACEVVGFSDYVGGGALPTEGIQGRAVKIAFSKKNMAQKIHKRLLKEEIPILSVLKEGALFFSVRAIDVDFNIIAKSIAGVISDVK